MKWLGLAICVTFAPCEASTYLFEPDQSETVISGTPSDYLIMDMSGNYTQIFNGAGMSVIYDGKQPSTIIMDDASPQGPAPVLDLYDGAVIPALPLGVYP